MTTWEMIRCKKCSSCTHDENGEWKCKETGQDIHEIKDDNCPMEADE